MDYSTFLSITLTALAVMLAILGLGLAIIAIWGYRQIKLNAEKIAEEKALAKVALELEKDGKIYQMLIEALSDEKGAHMKIISERVMVGITQFESAGTNDPEDT